MTVLAIDIQKGITNERLYDYEGFIKSTNKVLEAARKNHIEVIYIQHDDGKGSGFSFGDKAFEIADEVAPCKDEKIFTKTINSCFGNKDLVSYLRDKKEDSLMIVGLQTNLCIDASVKSAFERGFKVIIPAGTNSTVDNDFMDKETTYNYYNSMMWPKRFASCVSLETAIEILNKF
ncbi:MAG: isochorismatase family protein [Treponema sp.]|nr:isochorismatase family protein [Treponema sp.]